jgi:hypothetical protein
VSAYPIFMVRKCPLKQEKGLAADPDKCTVTEAPNLQRDPPEVGGAPGAVRHVPGQRFYGTMDIVDPPPRRVQVTVSPSWSISEVILGSFRVVIQ